MLALLLTSRRATLKFDGGPRRITILPRGVSEPGRPDTVKCLSAMAARWLTSSAKPAGRAARNFFTNSSASASVFTVAFHSARSLAVMKYPCGEFGQFLYFSMLPAKRAGARRAATAMDSSKRDLIVKPPGSGIWTEHGSTPGANNAVTAEVTAAAA